MQQLSSETKNQPDIAGVEKAVLQFKKIKDYTTFTAEYTIKDEDDIVIHFYSDEELQAIYDAIIGD